jgi:thiol-disulfide isomerase/thioredoxin
MQQVGDSSLAGRMDDVKRMALVVVVMVVGISMMLWAGWHNLRERRLAMQQAQQSHVALVPGSAASPAEDDMPKLTGKTAPAFTLTTLDGKKVSLADYKGKSVLVNFWATWCAPCKIEMPWFEEFRKQYAAQDFVILGVTADPDAGKDTIAKVAQKTGVTYPILLGTDATMSSYGGVDYLPMSFYVNKDGVVVTQTAGLGTKDEIEANIKKLIAASASASTATTGSSTLALAVAR